MRVGIVSPEYPPTLGGVARSVRRIARHLAGAGVDVSVAVLPNALTPLAEGPSDLALLERDGLVKVYRLGMPPHAPTLPKRRAVACYEWLCGFAATVDLIHCFYISETGFLGGMAAKAAGVPFLASVRGNDVHQSLFDGVELPQIVWTLQHADALTFVATALRDEAWRVFPFKAPAYVIWNSVDPADFPDSANDEIAKFRFDRPSIGMAGELRHKKGVDRLLDVCGLLRRPVEVLLVGEFNVPEADHWRDAIVRSRLGGLRVTVTGRVPHREMLAHYRSVDVMAFPARHDGCPNSLLEAMLAGCACACTRVGAMGEIIDASGGGVVVDPCSPARLQKTLENLVEDVALRVDLGARAKDFALSRLAPDHERAAWQGLYESLG